ncbi:MAG: tetratricopeptide repeat protein [Gemmatimonadetes bacterium]|nr:tetratricopeptide repeat protein [Gemmatimonadota bacterium]
MSDEPGTAGRRVAYPFWALVAGSPVPAEGVDLIAIDRLAENHTVFYSGVIAAELGHWTDHNHAIEELERREDRAWAAADSAAAFEAGGRARALTGYGLWRQGRSAAALPLLEDPLALNLWLVRWWLGQLYVELNRFRDAEWVYRSYSYLNALSIEPLAQNQLGKIYEALGEYDKARESYEYFVEYWRDADPELQPIVEEARRALALLEGR